MDVKAYLNPNPPLDGGILVNPHGKSYSIKNEPFLEVEMKNFPEGEYRIELLSPFYMEQLSRISSPCSSVYLVDRRFSVPALSSVKLKVLGPSMERKFDLAINVFKLSGRISDFDGNPRYAFVWATQDRPVEHEIIVSSNDDGEYTLYYPSGRRLRVFVDDDTYGKTSLECWIMANELKGDVEISPHIRGSFEFYEYRVWYFGGVWNVFFVPAVIDSEFPPDLVKEDIKVFINGVEGQIKKFTKHRVYFGPEDDVGYPSYILSVAMSKSSKDTRCMPDIIRIFIDSPKKGRGEAWFIHY